MPENPPPIDEQRIEELESSFVSQSDAVFAKAQAQALRAGHSVIVSDDRAIYELFPDGQRKFIKSIAPPRPDVPGRTVRLK